MCGFEGTYLMHEWLSGGVSPCQGEGRGFESRLVLFLYPKTENAVFIEVLEIFCFSFIAFCLFASMIKEEVELCVGGSFFDCRT